MNVRRLAFLAINDIHETKIKSAHKNFYAPSSSFFQGISGCSSVDHGPVLDVVSETKSTMAYETEVFMSCPPTECTLCLVQELVKQP